MGDWGYGDCMSGQFFETGCWDRMGFGGLHLSIKGFVSGTEFFEPGNKDWGFSGHFRHGFCIFCYLYLFAENLEEYEEIY